MPTKRKQPQRVSALKVTGNDELSPAFGDLIPPQYRGSDRFLDVVCWNVRYFHDKDPQRVERVTEVLAVLNADLIVLEEIMEGSLAPVASALGNKKAGNYTVAYGTTGGQQRVGMMWDIDWVRAKDSRNNNFGCVTR